MAKYTKKGKPKYPKHYEDWEMKEIKFNKHERIFHE